MLQPQRNTEIALGFIMQAAFGVTTVIDGLTVIPTSPASLAVQVGPGSIITATTVDTLTSGFGSLAVDNTDSLVKIGINLGSTTMAALTAPPVAGQSQNWLVECQFLEVDGAAVVLPYYDAANPAISYSGPSNAGTPNNTGRFNIVQLQWRGGTPAVTGSQNTPVADAGWTPVALVTLANGQTTITSASITPYAGAPYVPTKMPRQRIRLTGNLNIYVSPTGSDVNNSGLSLASPFATLQRAWTAIITNYDVNGFQITVNVANGTYSAGVSCFGSVVGSVGGISNSTSQPPPPVAWLGNPSSPSSCVVSVTNANCFNAASGCVISVSGFKLISTGTAVDYTQVGCGLYASFSSGIQFDHCDFGSCSDTHIASTVSSIVESKGAPYTISGSAPNHMRAFNNSYITTSGSAVTLTGTPAFSTAFATAQYGGIIYINSATSPFSGSATGSRYQAILNGVIQTSGGGASFFPGNAVGTTATGGQYS